MIVLGRRRSLVLTILASLLIVFFYFQLYVDTERFIRIIPHVSSNLKPSSPSTNPAVKTARLHYLIPASLPNLRFCFNLVSSAVNRYPVPMLLGWHGTGELDAAKTHLAKLRTLERYLGKLKREEDDDLVFVVDGYDILLQLPAEIIVERYFEVTVRAEAHLASRLNITVEEAHAHGLRQTIFWGPDKFCWPGDHRASRCWAAPSSPIPHEAWGRGDKADPRWLNSGTLIGPVADLKKYIAATMEEIKVTYNEKFELRESDQFYVANVWGRQEYWRSKMVAKGGEVPGGSSDRIIPNKRTPSQETEYHVAIEHESALFQTKAGYEEYFGYQQFNGLNLTTSIPIVRHTKEPALEPANITMPKNVASALGRLYDAIPEAHPGSAASDWLQVVKLGVNYVTHNIYVLWHCTGGKEAVPLEYAALWFYPFVKSLLRAGVKASQEGELISAKPIDGRLWAPKTFFPSSSRLKDEFGGAWTDLEKNQFVPWEELCGEHKGILFAGEQKAAERL